MYIKVKLALILLFLCNSTYILAQNISSTEAKECSIRNGLPNFFEKLKAGKPVKIAYFGGSITEAKDGWREQSVKWFQTNYPHANITPINAAIGGTGSDLGVFRLKQHVLIYNPDLVFVEFAVNDNGRSPQSIYKSMEGIVRQIWQKDKGTDICFVYTLTADMAPVLQEGKLPVPASAMEQVADYYGIPSVHMGLKIAALAKEGELIFQGKPEQYPGKIVFSNDNVHPYSQTGHRLYTEALARAMQEISKVNNPELHSLQEPFIKDNWQQAQMISVAEAHTSGNWQILTAQNDTVARMLSNRFTNLIKSNQPGASISIRFKGTKFGLYDVMGPGCGQYNIIVDGKAPKKYPRFDGYSATYRSNYFFLPDLENTLHTVELQVSDEILDKATILSKRNYKINNPKKFAENACYASQIMIIGELVGE